VKLLGGARHVARLHHRHEVFELAQIHAARTKVPYSAGCSCAAAGGRRRLALSATQRQIT
jgi:hypothetical protein